MSVVRSSCGGLIVLCRHASYFLNNVLCYYLGSRLPLLVKFADNSNKKRRSQSPGHPWTDRYQQVSDDQTVSSVSIQYLLYCNVRVRIYFKLSLMEFSQLFMNSCTAD